MSQMRAYYYLDNENFIRIISSKKPTLTNHPNGVWPLREFITGKGFKSPCFGEITWTRLKEMRFIGSGVFEANK